MRKLLIAALVVAPFAAYGVQAVAEDAGNRATTGEVSANENGSDAVAEKTTAETAASGESVTAEALAGEDGAAGEALAAGPIIGDDGLAADAAGGGKVAGETEGDSDD